MKYEIKGTPLPVVEITVDQGESVICEAGAMSWMSPNMEMSTTSGGGIGKMFSKMISGEKLFQNVYTAKYGQGSIACASSFPGEIKVVEIGPGKEFICQKSAFLASDSSVDLSIFWQKKLGAGLFGGEGFVMQKLSGFGTAFIEIDGSVIEKELAAGEQLIVDTGYLAYMEASCSIDIVKVSGVGNVLFGGEGLFNTVVTGPGVVGLQTMPIYKVAKTLIPFIPTGSKD